MEMTDNFKILISSCKKLFFCFSVTARKKKRKAANGSFCGKDVKVAVRLVVQSVWSVRQATQQKEGNPDTPAITHPNHDYREQEPFYNASVSSWLNLRPGIPLSICDIPENVKEQ
jgi:hypothetical protein